MQRIAEGHGFTAVAGNGAVPEVPTVEEAQAGRFDEQVVFQDADRLVEQLDDLGRCALRQSVQAYLKCGDLREGFARVRCPTCAHEMLRCASCSAPSGLLVFDHGLLGALALAAWGCVRFEACRLLSRDDLIPGMIAGIQTHGEWVNWHPHIHALVTCGAFTETGEFVPLPAFDANALLHAREEAVYALYLRLGKIEPAVVEQIRGWRHSGFSVDQSVYLRAGDQAGIERLMQYSRLRLRLRRAK